MATKTTKRTATVKKASPAPSAKRGKPMNLYLHTPDEARLRELGSHIYQHRGLVSNSQVVKAALIVADADERLLRAFDVVKGRDLRYKKSED
jgi:hypothetical protein